MGRQPCCDKIGLKKGPWTAEEDKKLINFILINGQCCWRALPKLAGLLRCGKSCRLRWTNYLRPDLKRGLLSEYEEQMVIDLHAKLGNRWSKIASSLPGRTDNEIKNYWNTHIKKKLRKMGIDPLTHKPISSDCVTNETKSDESSQKKQLESLLESPKESENQTNPFPMMESITNNEVIMTKANEISLPCSSTSTSSSSSCSSKFLEDLQFTEFELPFDDEKNEISNLGLWEDDFCNWDFLMNDDGSGDCRKQPSVFVDQFARMVSDQEAWSYELL